MKYKIEELSRKIEWQGKPAEMLISCEIEITEHEYAEAEPDVGIMHPSYNAINFEIIGDINIFITGKTVEEEIEIPVEPANTHDFILREIMKIFIRENADWEHIDERLTEYNQG